MKENRLYTIKSKILKQYQKNNSYISKIVTENNQIIYIKNSKKILSKSIIISFNPNKITFYEYLTNSFVNSKLIITVEDGSIKDSIEKYIESQHINISMQTLFKTLFLGIPITNELNMFCSKFGINHLLAISGFHLSIILGIIYFLIKYPYTIIQDRYFPYRNRVFDTLKISIILLFLYLYLVDFVPSLFRAYIMFLIVSFLYMRGVKIISFTNLFLTIIFAISIFPKLIISLSFWLSILGVFYIFLFLKHFDNLNNWQTILMMNFYLFIIINPYIIYIFEIASKYQLLSPFLTIIFNIFYPLELALHTLNIGSLLDNYLIKLVNLNLTYIEYKISFKLIFTYSILSILSIYYKKILYILLFFSIYINLKIYTITF